MSSRSRGRHRFEQPEPVDPEEQDRVDEATKAFEQANTRKGLSKLVGMILDDRDKQLKPADNAAPAHSDAQPIEPATGLREMTPYHKATAMAMADKPMYGGTVEPERIAKRRARNRIARKSRRTNRKQNHR